MAEAFVAHLLSKDVQEQMESSAFSKTALYDTARYSGENPILDLKQVMPREALINLIFDTAITKRLPELQDAWLTLIKFEQSPEQQCSLKAIEKQLFELPLSKEQITPIAQKLATLDKDSEVGMTHYQALLAEFSHELGRAMSEQLDNVNQQLAKCRG